MICWYSRKFSRNDTFLYYQPNLFKNKEEENNLQLLYINNYHTVLT